MRKLALIAALAATVMLLPVDSADAGAGHFLEVSKTVVGEGGGDLYTIQFDCTQSGTFDIDVPADDLVNELLANLVETCTVSEPDTQGAQVSFNCTAGGVATCVDGDTFQFSSDGVAQVQIEVINTFGGAGTTTTTDPGATTTTTTTRPATAPTAAAVVTTPAFTG